MASISWNELIDSRISKLSIPNRISSESAKAAAHSYAEAGWFVLPVRNNTKHPGSVVGADWPNKSTRDADKIEQLFAAPDIGVALHVGKSGAICFDVDKPKFAPIRLSNWMNSKLVPFQSTRSNESLRGHYLFATTPGTSFSNSNGRLGKDWGEVRGQNGIIVVSPTLHTKSSVGGRYQWIRTGTLPLLPIELSERLPKSSKATQPALEISEVNEFLNKHTDSIDQNLLEVHISKSLSTAARGSRHDCTRDLLMLCLREAMAGLYPAELVVVRISNFFLTIKPSHEWTSPSEYISLVKWCVAQVQLTTPDELAGIKSTFETLNSEGVQTWIAGQQ
jgi:hypothetical protein